MQIKVIVEQGFDKIYRSILDEYKIGSGDVPPPGPGLRGGQYRRHGR